MNETADTVWVREPWQSADGTRSRWVRKDASASILSAVPPEDILWDAPTTQAAVAMLNARTGVPEGLTRWQASFGHILERESLYVDMARITSPEAMQRQILALEQAVEAVQGREVVRCSSNDIYDMLPRGARWSPWYRNAPPFALSPRLLITPHGDNAEPTLSVGDFQKVYDRQARTRERRRLARIAEDRKAAHSGAARGYLDGHLRVLRETRGFIQVELFPDDMLLPTGGNPCDEARIWTPWIHQMACALRWGDALRIRKKVLKALEPVEEIFRTVPLCAEDSACQLATAMAKYAQARRKRVGQLFSTALIDAAEQKGLLFQPDHVTDADRRRLAKQRKEGSET